MNVTFDFTGATQYGSTFSVNNVTQDGYTTGRLIGMDIDKSGVVQARFTNGRSLTLGQVALSNFANPQGLQQLADTNWAETFASGQALRGQAGNSGFGLIQSGALEASNVDITDAAGEHDHRAAQLPGERADDLHVRLRSPRPSSTSVGNIRNHGPDALRGDDWRARNPARPDRQQPQPGQCQHDRLPRRSAGIPGPAGGGRWLRLARVRHGRDHRFRRHRRAR